MDRQDKYRAGVKEATVDACYYRVWVDVIRHGGDIYEHTITDLGRKAIGAQ